jgi:hypothetical protein
MARPDAHVPSLTLAAVRPTRVAHSLPQILRIRLLTQIHVAKAAAGPSCSASGHRFRPFHECRILVAWRPRVAPANGFRQRSTSSQAGSCAGNHRRQDPSAQNSDTDTSAHVLTPKSNRANRHHAVCHTPTAPLGCRHRATCACRAARAEDPSWLPPAATQQPGPRNR